MNKELTRIPFNEFASNLSRVFDRVVKDKETVMVEKKVADRQSSSPCPLARAPAARHPLHLKPFWRLLAVGTMWIPIRSLRTFTKAETSRRDLPSSYELFD